MKKRWIYIAGMLACVPALGQVASVKKPSLNKAGSATEKVAASPVPRVNAANVPLIPIADQAVKGSYLVQVSYQKTTHLLFPAAIKYIDIGSPNVIADKADGIENILRVKADTEGFKETNMTVVTADGRYYSFLVTYEEAPSKLSINMANNRLTEDTYQQATGYANSGEQSAQFVGVKVDEEELAFYADLVARKKRFLYSVDEDKHKMSIALHSIYMKDDLMFYKLVLENQSEINYDIDFIKFYVRDKQASKRTVSQQIEMVPYLVLNGDELKVLSKSQLSRIYTFPKITIPDGKVVEIEVFEKGGGRHLTLVLKNEIILTAKALHK